MPGHHTAQSIDRRAADAAKFAAARAPLGSNDYAIHFISALTGFFALPPQNRPRLDSGFADRSENARARRRSILVVAGLQFFEIDPVCFAPRTPTCFARRVGASGTLDHGSLAFDLHFFVEIASEF